MSATPQALWINRIRASVGEEEPGPAVYSFLTMVASAGAINSWPGIFNSLAARSWGFESLPRHQSINNLAEVFVRQWNRNGVRLRRDRLVYRWDNSFPSGQDCPECLWHNGSCLRSNLINPSWLIFRLRLADYALSIESARMLIFAAGVGAVQILRSNFTRRSQSPVADLSSRCGHSESRHRLGSIRRS